MSPEERHLHIDVAAWCEANMVDEDGAPLRLSRFQREIVERIASGERVAIVGRRSIGWAAIAEAFIRAGAVDARQAGDVYRLAGRRSGGRR